MESTTYFLIIGTLRDGRKFRRVTDSDLICAGINVWRGRKYKVVNGKRELLCKIWN